MRKGIMAAAAALFFFGWGCKKKQPEQIPQPKADKETAGKAAEKPPETAAGNYLRSRVGQIDKAKAAAALYEKSAQETLGRAGNIGEEGE